MSSKSDAESMPPPPPSLPKTPSGSPAKRPPHQQQSHQPRRSVSTKPAETPAVGEASAEAKQAQRMSQLERKVARLENELLGQLQYNFRMEQLEKEVSSLKARLDQQGTPPLEAQQSAPNPPSPKGLQKALNAASSPARRASSRQPRSSLAVSSGISDEMNKLRM